MAQQRPAPAPQSPAVFTFPSPGKTPKHPEDFRNAVNHAKDAMKAYDPSVLRQAVRELWELTLVGSEYHSSFICSTMFHRAPPSTLSRTLEQHGARVIRNAAAPIAHHLKAEELDQLAPILLPKFSPAFLDKTLALRLESIQAQQLVNMLGRAERLGYDVRDVVTRNNSGSARQEKVIPTANPIPTPPAALIPRPLPPQQSQELQDPRQPQQLTRPVSTARDSPLEQDLLKLGIAFCERCNRPCGGLKSLLTHRRSGLCGALPVPLEKLGKEYCLFCGQQFLGNGGLRYHTNNFVCGRYTDEHADVLMKLFADADEVWKSKRGDTETADSRPMTGQSTPSQRPGSKDPYADLTPDARKAFDERMSRIEQDYAESLKNAESLPHEAQKAEFARLKNLFNNKQSMTRKKFGIRLRERRSRAEIEDERNRLLGSRHHTPTPSAGKVIDLQTGRTPVSVASVGERESASRQGTPVGMPPTEGSTPSVASPVTAQHGAAEPAGGMSRPMPMSIAGSYTAPIRAPNAPVGKTNGPQPIEIDDDEDKMDTHSNTEMEVDEEGED